MPGPAKVVVYTSEPCGYCSRAKHLLDEKGVSYEEIAFSRADAKARTDLVELTGRYTVPQIVIDGDPIGGYHELRTLEEGGRLDALLRLRAA